MRQLVSTIDGRGHLDITVGISPFPPGMGGGGMGLIFITWRVTKDLKVIVMTV